MIDDKTIELRGRRAVAVCHTHVLQQAERLGRPRKAKGDLKFTVYVLTVHKHSWVQRRAGPKVPASARSPKGSSAAVMTTQTHAPVEARKP